MDWVVEAFGGQFSAAEVYDGLDGSPLQINNYMDEIIVAVGDRVAQLPLQAPEETAK